MKIERVLGIIVLLLHENVLSANELAQKFNVSKRTIFRDIETIEQAGFPIISTKGKYGGFSFLDSFRLDKYTFTEEEKYILLTSLLLKADLTGNSAIDEVIESKIRLLTKDIRNESGRIKIQQATLHREEIEKETRIKIRQIESSIKKKKKIEISYITMNGEFSTRLVCPKEMTLFNGSWYLIGYCQLRKEIRQFKLTRILTFKETDKVFDLTEEEIQFKKEEVKKKISLRFHKNEVVKLRDYFLEAEIVVKSKYVVVDFFEKEDKNLLPFLLMFAGNVEVLEPVELRKAHWEKIKEMNQIYLSNDDS